MEWQQRVAGGAGKPDGTRLGYPCRPRGPSIVKPTDFPDASSRFNCTSARTPPRDEDPREVA